MNIFRKFFRFNCYERDKWVAKMSHTIPAGSNVLDVGAGSCPYRELFKHCNYKTHDFAQLKDFQLRGGTGYNKIDYVSDINNISVDNASFDAIICTEVFEHIPEPILALNEFARILRPGGRLILTAPLQSGIHQEPFHFYGGFTNFWYEKFLNESGFKEILVEENGLFNRFYSQESLRFLLLNHPFKNIITFLLSPFWLVLCFILVPFAFIAPFLDTFDRDKRFTIGYHVTATRI
ncbi:MAG: methyltransferase domain-containing protein [Flavobacterium sp.]|nr:methyltransferase domain-containing protein [Flavobacterium sp.]